MVTECDVLAVRLDNWFISFRDQLPRELVIESEGATEHLAKFPHHVCVETQGYDCTQVYYWATRLLIALTGLELYDINSAGSGRTIGGREPGGLVHIFGTTARAELEIHAFKVADKLFNALPVQFFGLDGRIGPGMTEGRLVGNLPFAAVKEFYKGRDWVRHDVCQGLEQRLKRSAY